MSVDLTHRLLERRLVALQVRRTRNDIHLPAMVAFENHRSIVSGLRLGQRSQRTECSAMGGRHEAAKRTLVDSNALGHKQLLLGLADLPRGLARHPRGRDEEMDQRHDEHHGEDHEQRRDLE